MSLPRSFLTSILLSGLTAQAQAADSSRKRDSTSASTSLWTSTLVRTYLSIPMLELEVEGQDGESTVFEPNVQPDLGLALDYKDVSLALSQPMPRDADDDRTFGRTIYHDYKLSFFRNAFGVELGMHSYRGFHRDPDDVPTGDAETELPEQRPDLRKTGRFANFYYVLFDDDLALGKSIVHAPASNLRWSPIAQLGYDYSLIQSDSGLTPQAAKPQAPAPDDVETGGRFESYILSGGAAARYGQNRWQLVGMMLFGRSLQNEAAMVGGRRRGSSWQMGERFSLRVGTEYLVRRWLVGMQLMSDETSMDLRHSRLSSTVGSVVISAGTTLDNFVR